MNRKEFIGDFLLNKLRERYAFVNGVYVSINGTGSFKFLINADQPTHESGNSRFLEDWRRFSNRGTNCIPVFDAETGIFFRPYMGSDEEIILRELEQRVLEQTDEIIYFDNNRLRVITFREIERGKNYIDDNGRNISYDEALKTVKWIHNDRMEYRNFDLVSSQNREQLRYGRLDDYIPKEKVLEVPKVIEHPSRAQTIIDLVQDESLGVEDLLFEEREFLEACGK